MRHHVHPVNHSLNDNPQQEFEQKQKVEEYIFGKLEEYSREKSTNLFHLTSLSHIRRRLKRESKSLSKQFEPQSEEKIVQWIDETLERINSHFPHIQSLIEFEQFVLTDELYSSTNINNQWRQLQLQRAKTLLLSNNDEELLLNYQKYIIESLTPKQLEDNCLPLKTRGKVDLDFEYNKAEKIGREYLNKMFDDYKQRQYPNLDLIKEIINLGMKQMMKRPKKR